MANIQTQNSIHSNHIATIDHICFTPSSLNDRSNSKYGYDIVRNPSLHSQWIYSHENNTVRFQTNEGNFESIESLTFSNKQGHQFKLFLLAKQFDSGDWLHCTDAVFSNVLPPPFHYHILCLPIVFCLYSTSDACLISLSLSMFSKILKHTISTTRSTIPVSLNNFHQDCDSIRELVRRVNNGMVHSKPTAELSLQNLDISLNPLEDTISNASFLDQSTTLDESVCNFDTLNKNLQGGKTTQANDDDDDEDVENVIDEFMSGYESNNYSNNSEYDSNNESGGLDDMLDDLLDDQEFSDISDDESE